MGVKLGTRVRVVRALDTEIHDVSPLIGRVGRIVGRVNSCAAPWLVRFGRPIRKRTAQRKAVYVEAFWWAELQRV
jgi:hypothetical protein